MTGNLEIRGSGGRKANVKFVNLTPHDITVVDGETRVTLPKSGQVARVAVSQVEVGRAEGIALYQTRKGEVQGIPAQEEGTIYVVSLLVREALPARTDLASPGELIRDADGKPIGCRGLAING